MGRNTTASWHDIVMNSSNPRFSSRRNRRSGLAPPDSPEQAPPTPPSPALRGHDDVRRLTSPAASSAAGAAEETRHAAAPADAARQVKEPSPHSMDGVPTGLARTVVNMQQYYASELDELAGKLNTVTEELGRTQEENRVMQRRLDMHLVLLQGAVDFMEQVKEGRYGVLLAEQETETTPGGEYQEKAEGIQPQLQSSAPLRIFDIRRELQQAEEGSARRTMPTPPSSSDLAGSTRSTATENDLDLPPTPLFDRNPVRSTGQRAPKRRAPASLPPRKTPIKKSRRAIPPRRHTEDSRVVKDERRPLTRQLPLRSATAKYERRCDRHTDGYKDNSRARQSYRARSSRTGTAWRAVNMRSQHVEHKQGDEDLPFNDAGSDYEPDQDAGSSDADDADDDNDNDNDNDDDSSPLQNQTSTPSSSSSSLSASPSNHPTPSGTSHRPRYSTPRRTTTPRYASGPPGRPFRFHRMGRTVADVWREYKLGAHGNPAIQALEEEYGTGWRTGSLREVKYASNYVGVRQKVMTKVEDMCESQGIGPEEACRRLDERVDGRMQMLIAAVRRGEDPFKVIPRR